MNYLRVGACHVALGILVPQLRITPAPAAQWKCGALCTARGFLCVCVCEREFFCMCVCEFLCRALNHKIVFGSCEFQIFFCHIKFVHEGMYFSWFW